MKSHSKIMDDISDMMFYAIKDRETISEDEVRNYLVEELGEDQVKSLPFTMKQLLRYW